MRGFCRLAPGALAAVVACQGGAETAEQTQARLEQETASFKTAIAEVERKYEQWESAGLADSIVTLYTDDAVAAFPNQPPLKGKQAILENSKAFYALGKYTLDIRSETSVANGPIGIDRGTYVFTFEATPNTPPGMAAMFPDSGSFMTHFHLVNGQWKIAEILVNSMKPLPGAK